MRRTFRLAGAIVPIIALLGTGYAAYAMSAVGAQTGPPYTVTRSWGTFHLSPKIAAKIKAHQAINYVFSYQGTGIPLFSTQYRDGYQVGCSAGTKIYPLNCKAIAPVQTDANQQIAEIETAFTAGQIDCLSIEPTTSNGFTSITNQIMAKGIPVFTVGVTSNGHEFTNFTQVPLLEGKTAANEVLRFMRQNHLHFTYFAVSGGDPSQFWAQGRMTGFMRTIKAAIPSALFYSTPSSALNLTYDPATTYDKAKAFILGHPKIQVFENSDIGADFIDRALVDTGHKNKAFSVGWNVSKANLSYIKQGVQIATMDQKWAEQAAFGGTACAQFLAHGKILPNTQRLKVVDKANVAEAEKELNKVLSGH
jgi:ribose transport system substrate-binding protein